MNVKDESTYQTQNISLRAIERLQNRITFRILVLLIPLLALFTWYNIRSQRQNLEELLLQNAEAIARTGAITLGRDLENAISSGRLTKEAVFDTNYIRYWEFDPTTDPNFEGPPSSLDKYHTQYDAYTDENWQSIIDSFLVSDDIVFATAVDKNGYLPTHNTRWSSGDGSAATDRTKRIFNDPIGLLAAENIEQATLQQIYERPGTNQILWDVSAPIYVNGEHWGAFRVAIELAQNQERVATAAWQTALAMFLVAGLASAFAWYTGQYVSNPIERLTQLAVKAANGDLSEQIEIPNRQEITILAGSFNIMTNRLKLLVESLEQRVNERTKALATSTEVSRRLSTILSQERLVNEVVTQVQTAFNYYHAHIYLFDETGENLVMVGGTGEAGKAMLAAGHRLSIGKGLVGRAAATKTAVLVPDVTRDDQWLPNPLLPDTAAEVAIPITIGDQVLGVLDIQHNTVGVLNENSIALLESIANQVAIALQNARQVAQTRASQDRFALAVEGANEGIWDWDIPSNEVYFSPRWKAMIGYEDHEISNRFAEYEDRIHPEDHDRMMQAVNDYLEGRSTTYEHEFRLRHKDGSYRWILVRATLVRDEEGYPLRMAGSHSDITERKQIEEVLRFSQEQLTRTMTVAQMAYWEIDLLTSTVILNDHYYALLRTTAEKEGGYNFPIETFMNRFVHPDDIPALQAIGDNLEQAAIDFEGHFEYRVLCGDGTIQHAQIDYRLQLNEEGIPVKLYGSHLDVTERKLAERQLQEEQARLQAILESINVPLNITSLVNGTILYANEPTAEISHMPREEIVGHNVPFAFADKKEQETYINNLRSTGHVSNLEVHMQRHDGTTFWALLSASIIDFEGEQALMSSVIDVSERWDAQQALGQRATELATVAEVGTIAATILEPEQLLQRVVNLTKERFQLYHAHVYLLDDKKEQLVLSSGAGEIGQTMVREGRQIALSQEQSLVARAARTHQGVIINDVQAEPGFLPNPLLPHTRAEMAVPLLAGEDILGVLDVQADRVDRFSSEDVNIFITLANQVAVALQNARRYAEAQQALDELTRLQRVMSREGWQAFLLAKERALHGFRFDQQRALPIRNTEEIADFTTDTASTVTVPLNVRGETIGRLGLRTPTGAPIPPEKQALLQTMMQQISEALERARLAEQTQMALTEAETLSRFGAMLNGAHSYEEIGQAVLNIWKGRTNDTLTASIFELETDETGTPEWQVIAFPTDLTEEQEQFRRFPVKLTNSDPHWMRGGGRLHLIADTATEPTLLPQEKAIYEQVSARSIAELPLRLGNRWVGLVVMAWQEAVPFTPADERLLAAMVDQLALAVNSQQLLSAAQTRAQREQQLREISTRVSTAVDADAILRTAAQEIGRAFGLETFVFLTDPAPEVENSNGADAH
ncbi:MAG: GAF domain-containing protein [Ardenticatenaceae bacterium]|nr:GAF domain-containing protein [Ardenticatenaceae bacterium]